jgi:hypothetical protein
MIQDGAGGDFLIYLDVERAVNDGNDKSLLLFTATIPGAGYYVWHLCSLGLYVFLHHTPNPAPTPKFAISILRFGPSAPNSLTSFVSCITRTCCFVATEGSQSR